MSATQKMIETEIVRVLADAERPMTPAAIRPGVPSAVRNIDYEVALLRLLCRGVLCRDARAETLHYRLKVAPRDADIDTDIDVGTDALFALWTDGALSIIGENGDVRLTAAECRALRNYLAQTSQCQRGAA